MSAPLALMMHWEPRPKSCQCPPRMHPCHAQQHIGQSPLGASHSGEQQRQPSSYVHQWVSACNGIPSRSTHSRMKCTSRLPSSLTPGCPELAPGLSAVGASQAANDVTLAAPEGELPAGQQLTQCAGRTLLLQARLLTITGSQRMTLLC